MLFTLFFSFLLGAFDNSVPLIQAQLAGVGNKGVRISKIQIQSRSSRILIWKIWSNRIWIAHYSNGLDHPGINSYVAN